MNTLSKFERKNIVLVFVFTLISLLTVSCHKDQKSTSKLIVSSGSLVFHGNQNLQLDLSVESVEGTRTVTLVACIDKSSSFTVPKSKAENHYVI